MLPLLSVCLDWCCVSLNWFLQVPFCILRERDRNVAGCTFRRCRPRISSKVDHFALYMLRFTLHKAVFSKEVYGWTLGYCGHNVSQTISRVNSNIDHGS